MYLLQLSFYFSIFMILVIKITALFGDYSEKINKHHKNLIEKTQLYNNKKGSVSIFAASLIFLLSTFLLISLRILKEDYLASKYRKESYICYVYQTENIKDYVSKISVLNISIAAVTASKAAVVTIPKAAKIKKALKASRTILHYKYLYRSIKNKYCPKDLVNIATNPFIRNWPYKLNKALGLEESIIGLTEVRSESWTFKYHLNDKDIPLSKQFIIESEYSLSSSVSGNLKTKSRELGADSLKNIIKRKISKL